MKREIHRRYPIAERQALVRRLMERGILGDEQASDADQPGQCCDTGCTVPEAPEVPVVNRLAGSDD